MKLTVPFTHFLTAFIAMFVLLSLSTNKLSAQFDFGKSYLNVTKGVNGGTVEPGDTLEIRSSVVVRKNGASNTVIDNVMYTDAIPAGTTYIPGTVCVRTNEGKIYKQFTDVAGDDAGWISGATVRINMGYTVGDAPATAAAGGRIRNTHRPSFYGSSCIMIASFRVKVTSAIGTLINTGGGSVSYKSGLSNLTFNFPSNPVAIYKNFGICSNTVGVNALGTEFNGSFGSGNTKDRAASANVPPGYTYATFSSSAGMPNDYYYGVSNNTSGGTTAANGFSTLNTWAKPDNSQTPSHRIFSVWDIIGDHTGAANPITGNPATASGATGGYMLVVNAAYRIDSAFQHTISGLCPNTYYEISTWVRNICSKCGCDSTGTGATGAGYIPTAPGDSSGVYPNLTYELDGIDYYTTGNVKYTGQWIKKGLTFLTGAGQTSVTLKLINNAPGGGGNDWALDDITVATCSPNFTFTPTPNPSICDSNVVNMGVIVRSYFNNYTNFKWQKSINGGATWTDISGAGVGVPVWNGTEYTYSVNYPPFVAYRTDSGSKYRVVVGTTVPNLSNPNCQVADGSTTITLNILNCGTTLATHLVSFTGTVQNDKSVLAWTTDTENEPFDFLIEKSSDGINYSAVGYVSSYGNYEASLNTYTYTDPEPVNSLSYYRVKMSSKTSRTRYTRTIQLSPASRNLAIISAINPFVNQLDFYINAPEAIPVTEADLLDMFGRSIKHTKSSLVSGTNHLVFSNTSSLPPGAYTLRIKAGNKILSKSVIKLKN
ncbi:MAG: hypothetical protein JST09_12415 [Bacteroidetes bacterium]|nr:hypothetical protein [Bacteroidota bacterium]